LVRPIIQSVKNIRAITRANVPVLSRDTVTIVDVTVTPAGTSPTDVIAGTTVKAVYVELWVGSTSNAHGTTVICLCKNQQNAGVSFANMQDLQNAPFKKDIYYTTQGLTPDSNANPVPFIRQWIKIPKGKQRFGLGDTLNLIVANIDPTVEIEYCGLVIYKAYN